MVIKAEKLAYITSIALIIAVIAYVVYTILISVPIPRPIETPTQVKDAQAHNEGAVITEEIVFLPLPRKITNVSVEEAILWRRSIRSYTSDPIKLEHLALILWAAYGVTETRWGLRAAPSAGGTYPLEIYVVVGEKGVATDEEVYLEAGVYKYDIHAHALKLIKKGDYRTELAAAAVDQRWVREAPVNIVITAVFERTVRVYGERGRVRYVPMEVGHAGQNIYLMATALNLGTVVVGAFYDDWVARIISAPSDEVPMYIVPIGVPKEFRRTSFEEIHSYILGRRR